MKPKVMLIAPRNMVREMTSEADVERLLQSGSWCRVAGTKPISKGAAWQRQFRARNRLLGFKWFTVWLPPETFAALVAVKRQDEDFAELIKRLLELPNSSDE